MINTKLFFDELHNNGLSFYAGVPDSLLKDFCAYVSDNALENHHFITANEGAAVALATGYYLATQNTPVVYFQNSGLGNLINPLVSLADHEVYSIPMILLIGWRGEPGFKDEPQHIKQGRIQNKLLETLEVPYFILDSNSNNFEQLIKDAVSTAKLKMCPVAIVVKSGSFDKYKLQKQQIDSNYEMSREDAIETILEGIKDECIVVSTTGKASREVYETRKKNPNGNFKDFLTVGSMGHANQIALGVALFNKKKVICLDGDGALIMHMGSLAINGTSNANNFVHVILNNSSHESVGGQPTVGNIIDFQAIAKACCYSYCKVITTKEELASEIQHIKLLNEKVFLEIKVNLNSRADLSRPDKSPKENKEIFMKRLADE